MDLLLALVAALAVGGWMVRMKAQHERIALLARHLSPYHIEKNIETVSQGYLRALGEDTPARQEQIWALLHGNEQALARQVQQFADDFAAVDPSLTQVSRLPVWLPFAPGAAGSFDMREALRVHARGIRHAVEREDAATAKDRAYVILAELLLLQHTCHWFCRSKSVASARLLARHKTAYEQVVDAILPQTRQEYLRLVSPARGG